jgi:tetratricopeptide (TPR) repeat protein
VLGNDHPDVALWLNELALLEYTQGRYDEAQSLYQQSLEIRRKVLGEDHPDVATSLSKLAALFKAQGKFDKAELLYRQSLTINYKVSTVFEVHILVSQQLLIGLR